MDSLTTIACMYCGMEIPVIDSKPGKLYSCPKCNRRTRFNSANTPSCPAASASGNGRIPAAPRPAPTPAAYIQESSTAFVPPENTELFDPTVEKDSPPALYVITNNESTVEEIYYHFEKNLGFEEVHVQLVYITMKGLRPHLRDYDLLFEIKIEQEDPGSRMLRWLVPWISVLTGFGASKLKFRYRLEGPSVGRMKKKLFVRQCGGLFGGDNKKLMDANIKNAGRKVCGRTTRKLMNRMLTNRDLRNLSILHLILGILCLFPGISALAPLVATSATIFIMLCMKRHRLKEALMLSASIVTGLIGFSLHLQFLLNFLDTAM